MLDDPLPFAAGTAILTNACAILQNGATLRHNLAITQWRDFRASLAAADGRLAQHYRDPGAALALAERRLRLQLRGLGLLNAAVALFAASTVASLGGAFLARAGLVPALPLGHALTAAGGAALLFLLAAAHAFFREGACGRGLLRLHHAFGAGQAGPPDLPG